MAETVGNKQNGCWFNKDVTLTISVLFFVIFSSAYGFEIFDATQYRGKPNLEAYGIKPIHIVYGGRFWNKNEDMETPPRDLRLFELAQESVAKGGIAILDIEHWRVKGVPDDVVNSNIDKYLQVLEVFKKYGPNLRVGYYGFPPIRDYWRAIKGDQHGDYRAWVAENNRLRTIANRVDILFPSIYTFYTDQKGWQKYAVAQIREARRLSPSKPVFVFLWPRFHESNKLLKGKFLPPAYWRLQLETAKEYADGLVIWDGAREDWREDLPWWGVTKDFAQRVRD